MLRIAKFLLTASLLLLGPSVVPKPCAQSASNIIRPRMLIGERDPLTGYKLLRARYDTGARPNDDIDGWALTYLITGDESFAKRAVQKIRDTHTPEQVGSRTYPEYVKS